MIALSRSTPSREKSNRAAVCGWGPTLRLAFLRVVSAVSAAIFAVAINVPDVVRALVGS